MNEPVSVQVFKHDGTESRRWAGKIVQQRGPLIVIEAAFEFDVQHDLLGDISRGTRTIEYYWLDRWYNIFRFLEADGATRLYYCNINTPPILRENVLTYIDLDIDVLVQADYSHKVLDLDEFAVNSTKYGYSAATNAQARNALDQVISLIEARQGPFAPESERRVR
jgi:protein associated with RNAse G/E